MIKIGDTVEIVKLEEGDMQTAKELKVGDTGIVEMYVPVPLEKGGIYLVRFDKDLGIARDICEGNKVMIEELDDIDKYYTNIKEGMLGTVVSVLNFKPTTLYRVEVNGLFGTYGTACLKREQFTKIAD